MKKSIYLVIVVLCLSFVFGQSLMPKSTSRNESTKVTQWVTGTQKPTNAEDSWKPEVVMRKVAHFAEYTVLGLLYVYGLYVFEKRIKGNLIYPMFLGLSTAVIDEGLQLISHRGSQVMDVMLDFCGILLGTLSAYLFFKLKRKGDIE